jgi:hypothetical protein
MYLRK